MTNKTKFEISKEEIIISRNGWNAITTYDKDIYDKISRKEWNKNKYGYIVNGSLGYLHRCVMEFWYGKEVVEDMARRGFIVDHMNNDHTDCRLSNLEFLKKSYNTAKGQTFDVDSKRLKNYIAVNLFKDFTTDCYQVTIGFNATMGFIDSSNTIKLVNAVYFLYDCDYSIVVNDAENLLLEYETSRKITVKRNNSCSYQIEYAPDLNITEDERQGALFWMNGELYSVLGNGKLLLDSVHYIEGWLPSKK